jgi:hypothetical protein
MVLIGLEGGSSLILYALSKLRAFELVSSLRRRLWRAEQRGASRFPWPPTKGHADYPVPDPRTAAVVTSVITDLEISRRLQALR